MENQINFLIPKHRKLLDEEVNSILEKYSLKNVFELPKIKKKDQALSSLDVSVGDVIEITRKSFVGEVKYYRVVIN